MKTIEQKALAYDEAIEKIKYVMEHGVQPVLNKEDLQEIFPELKDNDEMIKREIIKYIKTGTYHKDWIEWLEKQGEQKPTDKVNPKFHEGDWIVWENQYYKVNYNGCGYELVDQNGLKTSLEYGTIDESAHLWDITKDAKDGDVLYSLDSNQPFIYQKRNVHEQATAYCGINKYGKFFVWNTKDCIIALDKYVPATKEQRDALFVEMGKAGYIFDFDKKELKEIEQKSVWSEEDEKNCSGIIDEIAVNKSEAPESDYKTYDRFIDWLKSLKDKVQFHWKPSGEQIDAFEHFVKSIGESGFAYPHNHNTKCVYSLLNDLKKL